MKKYLKTKTMPIGTVIDTPGSAREYKTGNWRNKCPVRNTEKCTNCLRCWIYCPEGCIKVKDGKIIDIDLDYCKGCGICAEECPTKVKAIEMIEEKGGK